jgi:hypothetical protein
METSEQRIVNGGSDALCDCGFGLHDHGECKTGARCYTCGVVYLYSAAKVRIDHTTSGTVTYFVCPYCGDNQFALWDNLAQANECYPNGCECQNNGDWCNHCQVLLDEDLAGLRAVGVKLPSPPEIGFDLDDSYIPDCGNCEEDERCEGCPVDCKSA